MIRRDFLSHSGQARLKLNLNRPDRGNAGKVLDHILPAIKVIGTLKSAGEESHIAHAVHAKGAQFLAQAAVSYDVPVSVPPGNPVWFHLALCGLVAIGNVFDSNAT